MYYRRKLILSIIQILGGSTPKIKLMKLLLIIRQKQLEMSLPTYFDFVPYQFGGYSFEANYDLQALTTLNFIKDNEREWFINSNNTNYLEQLKAIDKNIVNKVLHEFKEYSNDGLMKYTYSKYPYFAINSKSKDRLLNSSELDSINNNKPNNNSKTLYTIGYEGISLDTYLNKLIMNNVKVLVDVRRNAQSMKKGFNKNQLQNALEKVNIKYVHLPQLGIESEQSQTLNTQEDYDALFINYHHNLKSTQPPQLEQALELLHTYDRIAITCFEANVCQCHRGTLSQILFNHPNWKPEYGIQHL